MKRLDHLTVVGLIVGLGLVLWAIILDGKLDAFVNVPGLMITIGGSLGALLVNYQLEQVREVGKVIVQAFFTRKKEIVPLLHFFAELAKKARREGLLSLEDDLEEIDEPFLRDGLQMVIDGFEPESIRDIMETGLQTLAERHRMGQSLLLTWGSLAPAFGMIGTLIGLVQMLSSLDDPEAIGPGMAVALLTTFYGVLAANLVFNPIAGKLAICTAAEISRKEAIVDAVLALQAGVNPRILQEKLKAYLPPQEQGLLTEKQKSPLGEEEKGFAEELVV